MYIYKQLKNSDIPEVLKFLNDRKDYTLFSLGNIEQYGFENAYRGYAWYIDGKIVACVFNLLEKYITAVLAEDMSVEIRDDVRCFIESTPHEDFAAFAMYFDVLNMQSNYRKIRYNKIAKTQIGIQPLLKSIEGIEFCTLSQDDDLEQLAHQITTIEGFERDDIEDNKEMYRRGMEPTGYTVYAKRANQIVGAASVVGISKTTGVVSSVWVVQEARNKGIANQLLHRIFQKFLNGNRTLYIMYSNPVAAHIYLKNGFVEYGRGYIADK